MSAATDAWAAEMVRRKNAARLRAWREANPEKHREQRRRYRESEQGRAAEKAYRTRLYKTEQWKANFNRRRREKRARLRAAREQMTCTTETSA